MCVKLIRKYLPLLAILTLLFACEESNNSTQNQSDMFTFQYNLQEPDAIYELPPILKEISALSMSEDNELICLQDEDAIIFTYDLDSNTITNRVLFGKSNDFEGIEVVDETVFVLQSNGNIREINNLGKKNQEVIVHKNFLSHKNDAEGLGYDVETNSLLIACKGKAGDSKILNGKKAVYRFDLATKTLETEPFLLFNKQTLYNYIKANDLKKLSFKLKKKIPLNPSGIAAKDGFYYTIASIGNMLIVTDRIGNILYISPIGKGFLPKPEGITFDKNNRLIIASEAKNGNGRIAVFNPK
ncbi:MAG: hypothetical protein AB8G11_14715 [Saprospiraceae bacterium]